MSPVFETSGLHYAQTADHTRAHAHTRAREQATAVSRVNNHQCRQRRGLQVQINTTLVMKMLLQL